MSTFFFPLFSNNRSDEIILTGDQWNRIIAVDAHGNSLHNELTFPFKTNPNIKIDVIMEKRGILLKGTPEAVQAAKQHIGRALEKLPLSVDKYVPHVACLPICVKTKKMTISYNCLHPAVH